MLSFKSYKEYTYRYFYLLGSNKKKFPALVALFCLSSVFDMLGIGLIGPFIKLATDPSVIEKYSILVYVSAYTHSANHESFVIFIGLMIAVVFYTKSILGFYIQKIIMNFSFSNKASLINRLMKTYQNLDYTFHVERNSVSLIQRLIENTNTYTEMTLISSLRVLSELIVIACIFALLAMSSLFVTLTMLSLLGVMILVYDRLVKKYFHQAGMQLLIASENILKWFNQAIFGFKEIRILGVESYFYEKVKNNGVICAEAASLAHSLQSIPRYLAECALLTIVVGLVIVTLMNGGNVVDLLPILGVFAIASFRLIPSINKAATSFTNMRYSAKAMEDLYDDLSLISGGSDDVDGDCNYRDTRLNRDGYVSSARSFSKISLDEVSFSYSKDQNQILDNVTLEIKNGECIGVVGKSGSGKTTLIDVLLGLYKPSKGIITLDGKHISDIPGQWKSMIAYIPQNFFLLDDTFVNNIALESDQSLIDYYKLESVIKACSLEGVVNDLPLGVNSIIGEHGVKLSGGQRQRIVLARAFYHDREIIIMDEATSALDSITEMQIIDTISAMKGYKTLIVIAHKESTLRPCDRIFEMKDAKLTEVVNKRVLYDGDEASQYA